tara:strand:- start:3441 stop:4277 length:837 start_codon:yes stop_codon:yes gene_type:complete
VIWRVNINRFLESYRELHWIIVRQGELIKALAGRMVFEKHAGQALGPIWAFFHPAFLIVFYLAIFKFIFKVKFPESAGVQIDYTLYLLSGLVPWLAMLNHLNLAPTTFTNHAGIIKQIHLPLEVFPFALGISSLFYFGVFLACLLLYSMYSTGGIGLSILCLPVVLLSNWLFLMGVTFVIAPISTYFRDVKEIVQTILLVNMYLTPIIYPPGFLPDYILNFFYFNPFSYYIWAYQDVFAFGVVREPVVWIVMCLLGPVMFVIGYRVLSVVRNAIADSL